MNNIESRICAGIVTYNPDLQLLKSNIESILHQVDSVVVFDNGSSNCQEVCALLSYIDKCNLIMSNDNKGVAFALNRLCEWAASHNYIWIVTLDQDSISPNDMISQLQKYINDDVAIISPNIVYKNNEKYVSKPNKTFEVVKWVITSASLTNISIWDKLNGFDNWLFIDGVDYDYCLRANKMGYKVIRSYETELFHELGNLRCIKLFGKVIYVTNHSAIRKYYMSRNAVYLRYKLNEGNPFRTITKYIIKILFFEKNKISKISSVIRGVSDGYRYIKEIKDQVAAEGK